MDTLNGLIDASIRGTLLGITAVFWIFGLVAIWKRLLHWLFPKLMKKKDKDNE